MLDRQASRRPAAHVIAQALKVMAGAYPLVIETAWLVCPAAANNGSFGCWLKPGTRPSSHEASRSPQR